MLENLLHWIKSRIRRLLGRKEDENRQGAGNEEKKPTDDIYPLF